MRRRVCGLAVYLACLVGCRNDRLATYPVEGRVTFTDGKPLPGGTVQFQPVGQPAASADSPDPGAPVGARGIINEDGFYKMSTFAPDDGVVQGTHRVLVMPGLPPGPINASNPAKSPIHSRFQRYDTSGLEFTVTPDGPNHFEITVERP